MEQHLVKEFECDCGQRLQAHCHREIGHWSYHFVALGPEWPDDLTDWHEPLDRRCPSCGQEWTSDLLATIFEH